MLSLFYSKTIIENHISRITYYMLPTHTHLRCSNLVERCTLTACQNAKISLRYSSQVLRRETRHPNHVEIIFRHKPRKLYPGNQQELI